MPPTSKPKAKFIFFTGGVVSSLGKGIAAASLGMVLKARGLRDDFGPDSDFDALVTFDKAPSANW